MKIDCPFTSALVQPPVMGGVAAFFDMDHTITWQNSGLSSVRFARQLGLIPASRLVSSAVKILLYRLSLLNIESWYEKNMAVLSGTSIKDMERFCALWFDAMMKKSIYKQAFDLIQDHKKKGHRVAVISNSPGFFVKPVADALDIEDIISTRVEERDGVLTGRLVKPLCYGEGKRSYALKWVSLVGIDLSCSYFYTDSFFDLPLLKTVGRPVATNPDMKLRRVALAYGWPILKFDRVSAF